MLSKCANPECSAKFRYLHDGKVFRVEPDVLSHVARPHRLSDPGGAVPARRLIATWPAHGPEYFWLCSTCSEHSIVGTDSGGVVLVPFKQPAAASPRAAAAKASAA